MLLDSMGIILADHKRIKLGELNEPRALAATPFAGRYRIIDTMLSSMVNSGIKHVGVLAETKYSSLMDHIGTGSHWDLDRLQQGLRIIPPYTQSDYFRSPNPQDLTGLLDFLRHSVHRYVVVAESNIVANLDLADFVYQHMDNQADITIMYNDDSNSFGSPTISLTLEDDIVRDVLIDAENPETPHAFLGICVMERHLLIDLLSQAISRSETTFDTEFILRQHKDLTIKACCYEKLVLRINSITSYFSSSMRLLEKDVLRQIFKGETKISTKVKNEPPAHYIKGNKISNSLISDACRIAGKVKDSIIFRGVGIGSRSKVSNSIVMQDTQIMDGAILNNVIIDKDTIVRAGVRLQGSPDYPVIIGKGVVV